MCQTHITSGVTANNGCTEFALTCIFVINAEMQMSAAQLIAHC